MGVPPRLPSEQPEGPPFCPLSPTTGSELLVPGSVRGLERHRTQATWLSRSLPGAWAGLPPGVWVGLLSRGVGGAIFQGCGMDSFQGVWAWLPARGVGGASGVWAGPGSKWGW